MHIYREVSSATNNQPMNVPAVPTRTSSLKAEKVDKSRKMPMDLFERYVKTAYHPAGDQWIREQGNSQPPTLLRENGNAQPTNLRHSFRGLNGHRSRALSPLNNGSTNAVRVTVPDSVDREGRPTSDSPPMYKIRARSNSFKENNNAGWITVGPEFSIKPANGIQPVINVTILPTLKIPDADYNNVNINNNNVSERISGNGNITVQSLGNATPPRPALSHILKPKNGASHLSNLRETCNIYSSGSPSSSADREGLYQIYTPNTPQPVPPHSALPPTPLPEKERSRLSTLLRRRNSSMSRMHHVPSQELQRTYSMSLKPALKKRSSSQSYFEPKKSVTFSEFTTVFS